MVELISIADIKAFISQRYLRSALLLGSASASAEVPLPVVALRQQLSALPAQIWRAPTPRAVPSAEGRKMLRG